MTHRDEAIMLGMEFGIPLQFMQSAHEVANTDQEFLWAVIAGIELHMLVLVHGAVSG
jgi:hypothetical protein